MDFHRFAAEELTALAARLADAAAAEVAEARATGASALDAATATLTASFNATIARLRDDQLQLAADNERLTAENASLECERQALRERVATDAGILDRLAASVHAIGAARTPDAVAGAVAHGLAGLFARVLVLGVHDGRLEAGYRSGFDASSGLDAMAFPLGGPSLLTEAAEADEVRTFTLESGLAGMTPFGGTPRLVVTAPFGQRGDLAALLYADDSDRPLDDDAALQGARLARILRAHAAFRLEQIAGEAKAAKELCAYAQMLLDEVAYAYDADVSARRPDGERYARLQENLRCARDIFRQRVSAEDPAAGRIFDDVMGAAIRAPQASDFSGALTELVGGPVGATAA